MAGDLLYKQRDNHVPIFSSVWPDLAMSGLTLINKAGRRVMRLQFKVVI